MTTLRGAGWLAVIPALALAQGTGDAARSVITDAMKAMGGADLRTIQFSGMGSNAGIGQNINPKAAWPTVRVKTFRRDIDFKAIASHVELVRFQNGADQTQNQYVTADSPWSTQFEFWLTPFGFLKGALANAATVKTETMDGTRYNVVTYTLQNKYRISGYISPQNLVDKVQTWIDNDVIGDMPAEAWYSVYKDFGGVKFPTMIVEKQGGFPVLLLSVSDVKPNAAVNIQPPPAPAAAVAAAVQSEKVADGVFYLKGGTHHSVAVEFADYIVVVEAPLNEQRSMAVIDEVKKLIPGKPIRYVVNTHHHFDHSGGLRAYVAEGSTIITNDINRDFYQRTLAGPRTLNPDRLAQSPKKLNIETTGDKKVLTDGTRTLELDLIKGSPHHDGILLAFLPKEKILIEADVFTPPAPAAPAPVNPSSLNLVDNVEKLKLDFETILPLHGPGAATRADLYAAIRKPVPSISQILSAPAPDAGAGRGGGRGPAQRAPAVDGKVLLESVCTACHTLARVQDQKRTLMEWRGTVERMMARGADLSDDDASALIDYLAKTYPAK